MQRKISNTKQVRSGIHIQSRRKKLHSIPIINKVKSNVLYSIPCGCILALLLTAVTLALGNESVYAWVGGCTGTIVPEEDSTTVSPLAGGSSIPTAASLSLSNPNMTSPAITPGSIATVSTNVTVNVSNAESYSLTLKMNSDKLTSGNTTINAGNVVTDNTWGYKWDKDVNYTAPSTEVKTLTVPALSSSATSFTKNLTFGVKFASSADSGHYRGGGTLSLVATPKAATYTLADLTQMQQLSLAPDACANTPYLSGQNYSAEYTLTDVRDNSTYTVRRFGDGKCWMTQNLRINETNSNYCIDGRKLTPNTSDVAQDWTLPASSTSGFSNNAIANAYYDSAKNTGYYSWCAATADTCSSVTSSGTNAPSSICPKGWELPTGGTSGNTDFYNLFKNMNLTISGSLSANSVTGLNANDLNIIQNSPYYFAYTGEMYNSSSYLDASEGYWWSRTVHNNSSFTSYYAGIDTSSLRPGNGNIGWANGFAIRCVAK